MTVHIGDCLDVMAQMTDHSVNLIVTSPPYADRRAHTYGGVSADDYVAWMMPRAQQMARILTDDGSLILNIKESTQDGVRQTYVYDLLLCLVADEWRWIDEYCWHKSTSVPGKWPTRFRDGWERIYHLAPSTKPKMRQQAVMRPTNPATLASDQSAQRSNAGTKLNATGSGLTNPSGKARANRHQPDVRRESATGSRFGVRDGAFTDRLMSYPDNVLHRAVTSHKRFGHSAAYPEWLPEFFIQLFSDEGDVVLDPFLGSGTTYRVARRMGRRAIGIEINADTNIVTTETHGTEPML